MADILDEVLNDAKDEKRLMLFRAIFPKIIGFTVIVALMIALYSFWQHRKEIHNQNMGDMLVSLVTGEYKDPKLAQDVINKLLNDSGNAQAELTKLQLIASKIEGKKIQGAMSDLEALADSKNERELTSAYARILWLNLLLDQDKISDMQQTKARDYFQYFKDEKQGFFASANLLQSIFYQKNHEYDLAKEYAEKVLSLERAPMILKEQAKAVIAAVARNKNKN